MTSTTYDAVVLAGGRSRRMDVADKTTLTVGDRPLLDRALDAVAGADQVVVVGGERPIDEHPPAVTWTREQPPGAGPAAALAAGLRETTASTVVLLAGDMPFVTVEVVDALVAASSADVDGAVLLDDTGREQWLCSAWRAAALRRLDLAPGGSLHASLGSLRFARVQPAGNATPAWLDCDSPDDLDRAARIVTKERA